MLHKLLAASGVLFMCSMGLHGEATRPLAIEDYYRVLTITSPQISQDGRTVRFSVQTRIESDNGTKTETFTVPTDASAPPSQVADAPRSGGRGSGRGSAGVRVVSPDGRWAVRTQEKAQQKAGPKYASDFEQRHQERFKGAIFDWKDFQRDGAPFPAPNPAALPALQIVLQPASGDGDA